MTYLAKKFVNKHDLSETQQFRALVEEVGELSEALNTDASDEQVVEELADIGFIAYTLAEMRDEQFWHEVHMTAEENLQKSASTEGAKITKATGESE